MIASRRKQKNDLTRKQILSAAQILFTERGYDNTSIDDVAKKADIAKGTLYYHFDSKEAVAIALRVDSFVGTLQNALKALNKGVKPLIILEKVLLDRAAWTEKNPELAKVFFEQRIHQFLFREDNGLIRARPRKMNISSSHKRLSLKESEGKTEKKETDRFYCLIIELIAAAQKNKEIRRDIDASELAQIIIAAFVHAQGSWLSGYSSTSMVDKAHRWLHAILDGLYV